MLKATDLAWAAGFLEGEGSFGCWRHARYRRLTVSAVQVQREPLERLHRLFGGIICISRSKKSNEQDRHKWSADGAIAAGIMLTVYTHMSPRRREQINLAIARWKTTPIPQKYRPNCPSGHPYLGTNLVIRKDGNRVCRECRLAAMRRWYRARKAAA